MSKNRHCDRHDGDFSERVEDWSELRMTIHSRYQDSTPRDITESLDLCPACTQIMRGVQGVTDPLAKPAPAIATMDMHSAYPSALTKTKWHKVDPEEYQRYMSWLQMKADEPIVQESRREDDGESMNDAITKTQAEIHHPYQAYAYGYDSE